MLDAAHASISIVLVAPGLTGAPETVLHLLAAAPVPRMEVVLVEDGGATPQPTPVFSFPVLQPRSGRERGGAASRNRGAARAEGEVLLFPLGSRPLEPEQVQALYGRFAENPKLGAATAEDVLLVRASVFHAHGGFNPSAEPAHMLEFLARLMRAGVEVVSIPCTAPSRQIAAVWSQADALWRQAMAWGRFSVLPSERPGARCPLPDGRSREAVRALTPPGFFARTLTMLAATLGAATATPARRADRAFLLPLLPPRRKVPAGTLVV